jgi:hypothetical protein
MSEIFTWVPNWINQLRESIQDQRESETLGRSRGQTVEGYDQSIKFIQEFTLSLNKAEAQAFLAFWRARKGPWQAFKGPSIWIPGSTATAAPHNFTDTSTTGLLRFSDDELVVTWIDPNHCDIEIGLVQTIDGLEGDSYVSLYHIYCEDDQYGYADEYITEWSASVTNDGHVYTPARIESDEITESAQFQKETAKVNIDIRDSSLIRGKVQRKIDANVSVDIIQVNYTTGEYWEYFSGRVGKWERVGKKVSFELQLWSGIANLQLPTAPKCRMCPFSLFDGGCTRINPTSMAMSNWVSSGSFLEIWSSESKVRLIDTTLDSKASSYFSSHPNSAQAEDGVINWAYWNGGIAITGTGKSRQIRPLIFSAYTEVEDIHIIPMWPFRTGAGWLTVGDQVYVYPGCDGTYTMCSDKFSNSLAFLGQPFTPAYIEEAGSNSSASGK